MLSAGAYALVADIRSLDPRDVDRALQTGRLSSRDSAIRHVEPVAKLGHGVARRRNTFSISIVDLGFAPNV